MFTRTNSERKKIKSNFLINFTHKLIQNDACFFGNYKLIKTLGRQKKQTQIANTMRSKMSDSIKTTINLAYNSGFTQIYLSIFLTDNISAFLLRF